MQLCGVAPLRSTSTQKNTEKIKEDYNKKLLCPSVCSVGSFCFHFYFIRFKKTGGEF